MDHDTPQEGMYALPTLLFFIKKLIYFTMYLHVYPTVCLPMYPILNGWATP